MDDPSPQTQSSPPPPEPFKNWQQCFKRLKELPFPLVDADRGEFIDRIKASAHQKHIAFELLNLIQEGKFSAKVRWLELPMLQLLGDGEEDPNITAKSVPGELKRWVYRQFDGVRSFTEWKRFTEGGKLLWVLHVILRGKCNKEVLVEGLSAFAECLEHRQTSPKASKKKGTVGSGDVRWITKLIKARIPAKLELSNAFIETLFAINATATLSEALRKESSGLHSRLEVYEEALSSERQAKTAAEEMAADLRTQLESALAEVEAKDKELEEQRLHSTRQGGFNEVAKRETINQVMATVRQGTLHRLENLRAYADRENPNREEIIALVAEIEKHLSRIEEVVSP